jgi:hypothetical protein
MADVCTKSESQAMTKDTPHKLRADNMPNGHAAVGAASACRQISDQTEHGPTEEQNIQVAFSQLMDIKTDEDFLNRCPMPITSDIYAFSDWHLTWFGRALLIYPQKPFSSLDENIAWQAKLTRYILTQFVHARLQLRYLLPEKRINLREAVLRAARHLFPEQWNSAPEMRRLAIRCACERIEDEIARGRLQAWEDLPRLFHWDTMIPASALALPNSVKIKIDVQMLLSPGGQDYTNLTVKFPGSERHRHVSLDCDDLEAALKRRTYWQAPVLSRNKQARSRELQEALGFAFPLSHQWAKDAGGKEREKILLGQKMRAENPRAILPDKLEMQAIRRANGEAHPVRRRKTKAKSGD